MRAASADGRRAATTKVLGCSSEASAGCFSWTLRLILTHQSDTLEQPDRSALTTRVFQDPRLAVISNAKSVTGGEGDHCRTDGVCVRRVICLPPPIVACDDRPGPHLAD